MNIKEYAQFFENISQETLIQEYANVFDANAKFKDPFNDVVGLEKIYDIFQDMYLKLDSPRFKIVETIQNDDMGYIKWIFEYKFKNDNTQNSFEGVSRVSFNESQMVVSHVDYWDSGQNVYEKIPILSFFIKLIKNKIKS